MTVQVLLALLFLTAALWLALRAPVQRGAGFSGSFSRVPPVGVLCVLLAGGLLLRLVLGYTMNGFDADIACFKAWGAYTHEIGFQEMYYGDFFIDYPPGYLYVLYLTEFFRRLFFISENSQMATLVVKIFPILSDIAASAILWVLARKRVGEVTALLVSGAYAFCPAVIVNSAVWGQSDGFSALVLLLAVLALYDRHIPLAAILYGCAVLSKPQMLIFAPVFLLWVIRQKDWKGLILGVLLALGTMLLLAAPFVKNWDYGRVIDIYVGAVEYYAYFTINAYNLWALFGLNWADLPEHSWLLQFGVPLAVVLASWLMLRSKRRSSVFAAPVVLMFTVFIFCVKMHERYLFPVLLFLLLTFLFTGERRFLLCFAGTSFLHFLNVSYVLYLDNSYISPTSPQILLLSLGHVLLYGYTMYTVWRVFLAKEAPAPLAPRKKAPARPERERVASARTAPVSAHAVITERNRDARLGRADLILLLAITLVYAAVAFHALGDRISANTTWTPAEGESAVFLTDEPWSEIYYQPGIAPDDEHYSARVGTSFLLEVSDDGTQWATALDNAADTANDNGGSVYAWSAKIAYATGRYIRITSCCPDLALNELALKRADGSGFVALDAVSGSAPELTDEQNAVPLYPSYMNSMYFDEIYHARTAYEHILNLEPYENTHPTLGKLIMSLGIRAFGMNPFGWRFTGALFGVLMLPVLYHLLKRLFGSTVLSAAGTLLFAFDFMHYVQTRIATIDTYAVFFILLMYDAMVVFLQTDLLEDSWRKILPPLLFSGLFMGLGIASKWTVAYGAVGLAALFFGKLFVTARELRTADGKYPAKTLARFQIRAIDTCLWCCLFFVAIPFAIYFAAFLPLTTLPWNSYDIWERFWSYQTHMYNYHSTLQATHTFQSPWYQWPFDIRVVWYYGEYNADGIPGAMRTISVLGTPLLWWAGVPGLLYTGYCAVKKRAFPAIVAAIGFLSAYLPWVLVPRCTFIYHYFTAVPFMLVALLYGTKHLLALPKLAVPLFRRETKRGGVIAISRGHAILVVFLLVHLALFALFYPVLTGTLTTQDFANSLEWLPTWFFA